MIRLLVLPLIILLVFYFHLGSSTSEFSYSVVFDESYNLQKEHTPPVDLSGLVKDPIPYPMVEALHKELKKRVDKEEDDNDNYHRTVLRHNPEVELRRALLLDDTNCQYVDGNYYSPDGTVWW